MTFFGKSTRNFIRTTRKNLATLILAVAVYSAVSIAHAQAAAPAPNPTPDVLIFRNGDQLTGTLERGIGNSVVFKSDMAGEITVPLDKVKELHSARSFAVLRKDVPLKSPSAARTLVTPGTVTFAEAKVTVDHPSATPEIIPEAQISFIIDQATFAKQTSGKSSFFAGWNGAVNGGATIVRSTDYGETLTAGVSLVRAAPEVTFLSPRNRTSLDLQETYGKLTAPIIPQTAPPSPAAITLTSILHADAERDQYFSPRFFVLAQTAFDHNYSQGLKLQQIYGAGIGWTVIKSPQQVFDLKATMQYEKQTFQTPGSNVNLIGSTVSETYHRTLPRKLVFSEFGNFIPAFNHSSDYSANDSATLTLPVYKRLGISFTATDNYLNNPAVGYNKNSFQFVAAASYTLK